MELENGDGGGDVDSLRFYVAITIPQMPLSEIDGMVNQTSMRRAKERHLIFGVCWRHCSARCEIFVENQIFTLADLPSFRGPPTLQNGILRNGQKKLKNLKPIRFHRPVAPRGDPGSTARKSVSERRWAAARADTAPWKRPCVTTS